MRLLKIGTLNIPKERWEDALSVFSEIVVVAKKKEQHLDSEKFKYIDFELNFPSRLFFKICEKCAYHPILDHLSGLCIKMIRLFSHKLKKQIKMYQYDYIHSSYNDFDNSDIMTLIINPQNYTRAQKETRPVYSYYEKMVLKNANRVVLNDICNKEFYESKYGDIFKDKEMVFNLDEDVRKKELLSLISYDKKLSSEDRKIHAVILAGRVLSNPNDRRSGGRLFYIPLIRELINCGIVVHLHTAAIIPYNGNNPYTDLAKASPDFIIEDKLDFVNKTLEAYKILSRYDIGILHAHIANQDVTEFDKVNIPHRYYEYHLAHVVPIEKVDSSVILSKKALHNHVFMYNEFTDITLHKISLIEWDTPDFEQYVKALYFK